MSGNETENETVGKDQKKRIRFAKIANLAVFSYSKPGTLRSAQVSVKTRDGKQRNKENRVQKKRGNEQNGSVRSSQQQQPRAGRRSPDLRMTLGRLLGEIACTPKCADLVRKYLFNRLEAKDIFAFAWSCLVFRRFVLDMTPAYDLACTTRQLLQNEETGCGTALVSLMNAFPARSVHVLSKDLGEQEERRQTCGRLEQMSETAKALGQETAAAAAAARAVEWAAHADQLHVELRLPRSLFRALSRSAVTLTRLTLEQVNANIGLVCSAVASLDQLRSLAMVDVRLHHKESNSTAAAAAVTADALSGTPTATHASLPLLLHAVAQCTRLEELSLCRFPVERGPHEESVADPTSPFSELAPLSPTLVRLNLHDCKPVDDAGLVALAATLPSLQVLGVAGTEITTLNGPFQGWFGHVRLLATGWTAALRQDAGQLGRQLHQFARLERVGLHGLSPLVAQVDLVPAHVTVCQTLREQPDAVMDNTFPTFPFMHRQDLDLSPIDEDYNDKENNDDN